MLDYQSLFQCLSNAIHAIIPRRPLYARVLQRTDTCRALCARERISEPSFVGEFNHFVFARFIFPSL